MSAAFADLPKCILRAVSSLPDGLAGAVRVGPWVQIGPDRVLLRIPGVGACSIQAGREIEFEAGTDTGAVLTMVNTTARAIAMYQRGDVALEGSTLVSPAGAAIAVCGFSATGKSAIAATLCTSGWRLVCDDLTRVSLENGAATAWPGNGLLHLWRDTCEALGIEPRVPVRAGLEKYAVAADAVQERPVPLTAIVKLRMGDAAMTFSEVAPQARAGMVGECVFKPQILAALPFSEPRSALFSAIAAQARLFELRGAHGASVAELARTIAALA